MMKHLILAGVFVAGVSSAQTLIVDATTAETYRTTFGRAARYQPAELANAVFSAITAASAPEIYETTKTVTLAGARRDAMLAIYRTARETVAAHYHRRAQREAARAAAVDAESLDTSRQP